MPPDENYCAADAEGQFHAALWKIYARILIARSFVAVIPPFHGLPPPQVVPLPPNDARRLERLSRHPNGVSCDGSVAEDDAVPYELMFPQDRLSRMLKFEWMTGVDDERSPSSHSDVSDDVSAMFDLTAAARGCDIRATHWASVFLELQADGCAMTPAWPPLPAEAIAALSTRIRKHGATNASGGWARVSGRVAKPQREMIPVPSIPAAMVWLPESFWAACPQSRPSGTVTSVVEGVPYFRAALMLDITVDAVALRDAVSADDALASSCLDVDVVWSPVDSEGAILRTSPPPPPRVIVSGVTTLAARPMTPPLALLSVTNADCIDATGLSMSERVRRAVLRSVITFFTLKGCVLLPTIGADIGRLPRVQLSEPLDRCAVALDIHAPYTDEGYLLLHDDDCRWIGAVQNPLRPPPDTTTRSLCQVYTELQWQPVVLAVSIAGAPAPGGGPWRLNTPYTIAYEWVPAAACAVNCPQRKSMGGDDTCGASSYVRCLRVEDCVLVRCRVTVTAEWQGDDDTEDELDVEVSSGAVQRGTSSARSARHRETLESAIGGFVTAYPKLDFNGWQPADDVLMSRPRIPAGSSATGSAGLLTAKFLRVLSTYVAATSRDVGWVTYRDAAGDLIVEAGRSTGVLPTRDTGDGDDAPWWGIRRRGMVTSGRGALELTQLHGLPANIAAHVAQFLERRHDWIQARRSSNGVNLSETSISTLSAWDGSCAASCAAVEFLPNLSSPSDAADFTANYCSRWGRLDLVDLDPATALARVALLGAERALLPMARSEFRWRVGFHVAEQLFVEVINDQAAVLAEVALADARRQSRSGTTVDPLQGVRVSASITTAEDAGRGGVGASGDRVNPASFLVAIIAAIFHGAILSRELMRTAGVLSSGDAGRTAEREQDVLIHAMGGVLSQPQLTQLISQSMLRTLAQILPKIVTGLCAALSGQAATNLVKAARTYKASTATGQAIAVRDELLGTALRVMSLLLPPLPPSFVDEIEGGIIGHAAAHALYAMCAPLKSARRAGVPGSSNNSSTSAPPPSSSENRPLLAPLTDAELEALFSADKEHASDGGALAAGMKATKQRGGKKRAVPAAAATAAVISSATPAVTESNVKSDAPQSADSALGDTNINLACPLPAVAVDDTAASLHTTCEEATSASNSFSPSALATVTETDSKNAGVVDSGVTSLQSSGAWERVIASHHASVRRITTSSTVSEQVKHQHASMTPQLSSRGPGEHTVASSTRTIGSRKGKSVTVVRTSAASSAAAAAPSRPAEYVAAAKTHPPTGGYMTPRPLGAVNPSAAAAVRRREEQRQQVSQQLLQSEGVSRANNHVSDSTFSQPRVTDNSNSIDSAVDVQSRTKAVAARRDGLNFGFGFTAPSVPVVEGAIIATTAVQTPASPVLVHAATDGQAGAGGGVTTEPATSVTKPATEAALPLYPPLLSGWVQRSLDVGAPEHLIRGAIASASDAGTLWTADWASAQPLLPRAECVDVKRPCSAPAAESLSGGAVLPRLTDMPWNNFERNVAAALMSDTAEVPVSFVGLATRPVAERFAYASSERSPNDTACATLPLPQSPDVDASGAPPPLLTLSTDARALLRLLCTPKDSTDQLHPLPPAAEGSTQMREIATAFVRATAVACWNQRCVSGSSSGATASSANINAPVALLASATRRIRELESYIASVATSSAALLSSLPMQIGVDPVIQGYAGGSATLPPSLAADAVHETAVDHGASSSWIRSVTGGVAPSASDPLHAKLGTLVAPAETLPHPAQSRWQQQEREAAEIAEESHALTIALSQLRALGDGGGIIDVDGGPALASQWLWGANGDNLS